MIKEATGAQPVRQSRVASQRKLDDAFRGEFPAIILQNRDFAQELGKMDKSKIKQLMTAESFVGSGSGGRGLA